MKLEDTIQSCFDHYPDLFQSREQVLNQLFCVIGNGYDWVDGELVELDDSEPINPLDENGRAKQYNIITKKKQREDSYNRIVNDSNLSKVWTEILGKDLSPEKFCGPECDDDEPVFRKMESVYPLCRKYSYLLNYPNDIKPDWLEGIKETFEFIINNISDDAKACKDVETFREVSKEELTKIYNETFANR